MLHFIFQAPLWENTLRWKASLWRFWMQGTARGAPWLLLKPQALWKDWFYIQVGVAPLAQGESCKPSVAWSCEFPRQRKWNWKFCSVEVVIQSYFFCRTQVLSITHRRLHFKDTDLHLEVIAGHQKRPGKVCSGGSGTEMSRCPDDTKPWTGWLGWLRWLRWC